MASSDQSKPKHILTDKEGNPISERPWIFRTYAGHTNVKASNELYRANLATGQTGLSIAFDLATQCGYSSDDAIAKPEIGKVGVPINTLDDFHILFDQMAIDEIIALCGAGGRARRGVRDLNGHHAK